MFRLEVLGGVGEYGRNCFYIESEGRAILLDCGIMNNSERTLPSLTRKHVEKLDAVFVSHSHIDHTGALHLLREWDSQAPIIMSEETFEQLRKSCSKKITFGSDTNGKWLNVNDDIRFRWGFSGHLLGSVWYDIEFNGERIFYSGDYVAESYLHQADFPVFGETHYRLALIDSGHIEKEVSNPDTLGELQNYIDMTEGPFIIPTSFSGKTVDLALYLFRNGKRKIVVDSGFHDFFMRYEKAGSYLKEKHRSSIQKFNQVCLNRNFTPDFESVCLVPENEKLIEALSTSCPDAKLIVTGYSKPPLHDQFKHEGRCIEFFYKTHPDKTDLRELVKQIRAKDWMFFHSTCVSDGQIFESEVFDSCAAYGKQVYS